MHAVMTNTNVNAVYTSSIMQPSKNVIRRLRLADSRVEFVPENRLSLHILLLFTPVVPG